MGGRKRNTRASDTQTQISYYQLVKPDERELAERDYPAERDALGLEPKRVRPNRPDQILSRLISALPWFEVQ